LQWTNDDTFYEGLGLEILVELCTAEVILELKIEKSKAMIEIYHQQSGYNQSLRTLMVLRSMERRLDTFFIESLES
jgi:hypothetical protein